MHRSTQRRQWQKKVMVHHFGKAGTGFEFKPAGHTNYVFESTIGRKSYIIRLAPTRDKLHGFLKEQWVVQKVREAGVPVAEILEVGSEVIPVPYMLQEKVKGAEAVDHPLRGDILCELGKLAKQIHSIPTEGFGNNFDWSHNKLSKQSSWNDYLEKELQVSERIKFLYHQNILPKKKVDKLAAHFKKISKWKLAPALNHCDLRLKNVIVDKKGKIQAVIDWENSSSNMAPYWDFSIALHDLSIDNKQRFLEGYELDFAAFEKMAYALTAFNLVNYIPSLQRMIERKEVQQLEFYKLRINGELDLFSL